MKLNLNYLDIAIDVLNSNERSELKCVLLDLVYGRECKVNKLHLRVYYPEKYLTPMQRYKLLYVLKENNFKSVTIFTADFLTLKAFEGNYVTFNLEREKVYLDYGMAYEYLCGNFDKMELPFEVSKLLSDFNEIYLSLMKNLEIDKNKAKSIIKKLMSYDSVIVNTYYDSKLKTIKRICNIDFARVILEEEKNDISRK